MRIYGTRDKPSPGEGNKMLIRNFRHLIIGMLSIIILIFAATASYELFYFSKLKMEYDEALEKMPIVYKTMPPFLIDVISSCIDENSMSLYVSRRAIMQIHPEDSRTFMWNIHQVLCSTLIRIHYSKEELIAIWSFYAPFEKGEGLNEAAILHFHHNLNGLSPEEIIRLVAYTYGGEYYIKHPEDLEKRVQNLVEKYKKMSSKLH